MRKFSKLVLVAFVPIACSSQGEQPTPAEAGVRACVPGQSIACTGPGPCSGFQVCRADGLAFDPCKCGVEPGDATTRDAPSASDDARAPGVDGTIPADGSAAPDGSGGSSETDGPAGPDGGSTGETDGSAGSDSTLGADSETGPDGGVPTDGQAGLDGGAPGADASAGDAGLLRGATAVAVGDVHACALLAGGSVACWGENNYGQLGDGTTTSSARPRVVPGVAHATAIAAGWESTCALISDGTVQCWGLNVDGQLGVDLSGPQQCSNGCRPMTICIANSSCSLTPVTVPNLTGATQIAVGFNYACALLQNGTVTCWGDNSVGQLGALTGSSGPVTVSNVAGATAITAGRWRACALVPNDVIDCWGDVYNSGSQTLAAAVPGVVGPEVSAGGTHSCALLADGGVACWGSNAGGELGDGTFGAPDASPPIVAVDGLAGATAVAAGHSHTCALLAAGTAACWGDNQSNELGNGTMNNSPTPVAVSSLTGATALAAGVYATCVLVPGGLVECWGNNPGGLLGTGSADPTVATPSPVFW